MLIYNVLDTFILKYGESLAYAIGVMIIAILVFTFLQRHIVIRLEQFSKKTKTSIDDAVVAMIRSIRPPFYWFLSFYLGLQILALPTFFTAILNGLLLAVVLWYTLRAAGIAIDMQLTGSSDSTGERTARHFLSIIAKATLWIIAILLLLSNLGINITSLVAGLGIGGIAIAFALQNILTDLFSSFAIYFDKPFVVGDYIVVGEHSGVVERVGIKTTHLRALQGEDIVISNRELTSVRVQNFHSMHSRRIQMQFGITYETPYDIISTLSAKINKKLGTIKNIRIDRVHFAGFGESSLDFILVYYVNSGDYTQYMDKQQELNLALLELFAQEHVEFAYPTRTMYVAGESNVQKVSV